MSFETSLTRRLQIAHPIIQAPMAGGGDTPELVAAVSDAGAFGSIGAAYLTATQIIEGAQSVRQRTSRPFGINLFASQASLAATRGSFAAAPAIAKLAPFYTELGLPPPAAPGPPADALGDQITAALKSGAAVLSFTFGILPAEAITAAKGQGMLVMGTATTVAEAIALQEAGVDAIIAQGSEAGGHRGSFAPPAIDDFVPGMIGTMALVPQIVDAVPLPVVASGGIMDGRGIAAALALGAAGVQLGTAFLTCDESGIPEAYKEAILAAHANETRITRAFSGRPARGIVNRLLAAYQSAEPAEILPFPLQNTLTRPLRTAASKAGRAEFLSLWAGQGLGLARREKAAALVERLARELTATVERLRQES